MPILILEPSLNKLLDNFARCIKQENGSISALSGTNNNLEMIEKADPMDTQTRQRIALGDDQKFQERVSGVVTTTISTLDVIVVAEKLGVITTETAGNLYDEHNSLQSYDYQTYKNRNERKVSNKFQLLSKLFGIKSIYALFNNNAFKP
ncbi:MAG: hypothetical protein Q8Q38_00335 [bacterium]|nr:hypothetical protein [bacterium]